MRIMLANTTGVKTGFLAGRYPDKIGHLFSPGATRGPYSYEPLNIRYALDNEAFTRRENWDEQRWRDLLAWAKESGQIPLWALCPDVVADRRGTLERWSKYAGVIADYGWPAAFAVQDGMTADDVPSDASVVFVGGSTEWKWETMRRWCGDFPNVHVGRVNTYRRWWQCHDAGASSTDGTGPLRGDQLQWRGLLAYLDESTGAKTRETQLAMFDEELLTV